MNEPPTKDDIARAARAATSRARQQHEHLLAAIAAGDMATIRQRADELRESLERAEGYVAALVPLPI